MHLYIKCTAKSYFLLAIDANLASDNRSLRDIKNLFEHEEKETFYKPVGVSNFWTNNYIEYESNGDRNKILSVEEYLNKIRPYLKDVINSLKKSGT